MNRVTRMGIGLVATIPVLGLAGLLFMAIGIEGSAAAWMALGVAAVWITFMIWWALRAPPQLTEKHRARYLAFLRHAEYEPLDTRKDRAHTR